MECKKSKETLLKEFLKKYKEINAPIKGNKEYKQYTRLIIL
jgi:hypothetical protein